MVKSLNGGLSALIALLVGCAAAPAVEDIIVRSNPQQYRLTLDFSFKFNLSKSGLSRVVVALPWPVSDQYQDVVRVGPSSDGYSAKHFETGGQYYSEELYNYRKDPFKSLPFTVKLEFDATLYDINVDFDRMGEAYPYLHSSSLYRVYTRNQGTFVMPNHARIVRLAEHLGQNNRGVVEFARAAHLYVAEHYRHLDPADAISPLEEVLENRGGTEADVVSVFVSLLRRRGIPARHVVGVTRAGGIHVAADFYLEHYGWIPVDVVKKIHNPHLDCFGVIEQDNVMVVLSHDVGLSVKSCDNNKDDVVDIMTTAHCDYGRKGSQDRLVGLAVKKKTIPLGKWDFSMKLEHMKVVREPEHVVQF